MMHTLLTIAKVRWLFVATHRAVKILVHKCCIIAPVALCPIFIHVFPRPSPRRYCSGWGSFSLLNNQPPFLSMWWFGRVVCRLFTDLAVAPIPEFCTKPIIKCSVSRFELGPDSHPRLIIWFLNNLVFMVWGLLASRPTPNLEDQGIPLRLAPNPW
jgi:hypothetical protein